jgi:hypothetical protein
MSNEDPQAQPSVPPVPPAPPAPALPPVPRYGEYAPEGAVPAAPVEPAPPAPAAPVYGYALPTYGDPAVKPPRKRRTWDLVLTIVLLVVGFFGMLIGVLYGAIFNDPSADQLLKDAIADQGRGDWNGSVGSVGTIIIVSHLLLYVRIVVFWIPLVAGVIAAVIFWGALAAIVLSDPNFVNTIQGSAY